MELPVDYTKLSAKKKKLVREEYVRIQNGICPVCKRPLDNLPSQEIMEQEIDWSLFPPFFLKHPVHLHHCHKTGQTISAIHARCNAYQWVIHGE